MAQTLQTYCIWVLCLLALAFAPQASTAIAQVTANSVGADPYSQGGYPGAQAGYPSTGPVIGRNGAPVYNNNYGPSAPMQPTSPARPASWPNGPQPATPNPPANRQYSPYPPTTGQPIANTAPMQGGAAGMAASTEAYRVSAVSPRPAKASPADPPYDPAEIVAHVGSEVIQASEVLPSINDAVSKVLAEHPDELSPDPEIREMQLNQFRRTVMKQALEAMVQVKLLLCELRRKVPPEGLKKNEEHLRKAFNTAMIPRLMDQYKATSVIDLENKLTKVGSSLEMQRTVFSERELAGSWLRQQIKDDPSPPTHEQMLTYFRQHSADWDSPARVRWLQLTAKFSNFGSKEEAKRELARWGNRIYHGEPFEQVAKAHSQDFASEDGGLHDWASKGSLRSQALDDALFSLPKGALSQILEDEDGFHIVRVLDREDARQAPFTEVQADIKKKLQDKGKDHRQAEYLAKLRDTIPVWTIFDEDFTARTSAPAATNAPATDSGASAR